MCKYCLKLGHIKKSSVIPDMFEILFSNRFFFLVQYDSVWLKLQVLSLQKGGGGSVQWQVAQ